MNDLDNVLYEIANEGERSSLEWQYHMIRVIKQYEATKPKQHPVGMTLTWPEGTDADLLASPADWISPEGPLEERPVASGAKVIISDTDHLCGTCGSVAWVWESFTRGENPVLMDGYDGRAVGTGALFYKARDPVWEAIRRNFGFARTLARELPLASMLPRPDLASTRYCLASTATLAPQYVVFAPEGGTSLVDLTASDRSLSVTWLDPSTGQRVAHGTVAGGATRALTAPFPGPAVLMLR